MSTIRTRMGDGYAVEMTPDEVRADLQAGSADAVKSGKVPTLEEDEFDYLFDLFANPSRISGVERGHEVVLTKDGSVNTLYSAQLSSGVGLALSAASRASASSSAPSASTPWRSATPTTRSSRPSRSWRSRPWAWSRRCSRRSSRSSTAPCPTSASTPGPTGPFPNPADLLPRGEIEAARAAQMAMAEACKARHALRGAGTWPRWAPTASTSTRPPRPATPSSSPPSRRSSSWPPPPTWPSRSAWRPSSCSASTARSSTTARASPACGRTSR